VGHVGHRVGTRVDGNTLALVLGFRYFAIAGGKMGAGFARAIHKAQVSGDLSINFRSVQPPCIAGTFES
jgi:hypothetical protein